MHQLSVIVCYIRSSFRCFQSLKTRFEEPRLIITMTSKWVRWRLKSQNSRLFTQLFIQSQIKETSKLRATGLCEGNSPVTGEFPAQRASKAENVSIWWRHHGLKSNWQRNRFRWPVSDYHGFHFVDLRKYIPAKVILDISRSPSDFQWCSRNYPG